jgi:hypothetical protein
VKGAHDRGFWRRIAPVMMGIVVVGALPLAASAQTEPARPALTIELPADSLLLRRGPLVRATGMLSRERTRNLLLAGFPARFHVRVELWSEGPFWLDGLESSREYDMFVRFLPVERKYEVILVEDDVALSLGKFEAVAEAERAVGRAVAPRITGARIRRPQYYLVSLIVETLSEKDLDEVERWLKGDIEPGITGNANPASLFSRIVKPIASRLLGGEKVEYEATSDRFRVRP